MNEGEKEKIELAVWGIKWTKQSEGEYWLFTTKAKYSFPYYIFAHEAIQPPLLHG